MLRRSLLAATALAVPAAILAGCGQTTAQVASEVVADAGLIAKGLASEIPVVSAFTTIPAATLTAFIGYLNQAVTIGQTVTSDITTAQALPLVKQIATYVGDAVSMATSAPLNALLPPGVLPVLEAASALLPVLEAAVGLAGATTVGSKLYTPTQARVILAAAAV